MVEVEARGRCREGPLSGVGLGPSEVYPRWRHEHLGVCRPANLQMAGHLRRMGANYFGGPR